MAAEMNDAFDPGNRLFDLGEIGEIGRHEVVTSAEVARLADIARAKMRIDAAQDFAQAGADIAGRAGNEDVLHHALQTNEIRNRRAAVPSLHFYRRRSMLRPLHEAAMADNLQVTGRLAQFVAETQWDALSPAVIHQAKRALVNFFAVALIGCREPAIETALKSLARFSGVKQGTVIGRGERLDV